MKLQPNEIIRIWRRRMGLTQAALGMRLQCSQMTVSRLERGVAPKSDEEKERIEAVLGVKIWSGEDEKDE
ncbi:helix-turn-helix transcriptional regulator [Brevibacillus centrosporus]|uniref:helix-turn-helix transcriptional regulator n=1 Tax=Brevibacillus centrosporus TaxID=54910 RepID=UPI003B01FCD7